MIEMGGDWQQFPISQLEKSQRAIAENFLNKVKCSHNDVVTSILFKSKNHVKMCCSKCLYNIFIKIFCSKEAYECERRCYKLFTSFMSKETNLKISPILYTIEDRYYAIIEEYLDYDDLFVTAKSAVFNGNTYPLSSMLSHLARSLSVLHEKSVGDQESRVDYVQSIQNGESLIQRLQAIPKFPDFSDICFQQTFLGISGIHTMKVLPLQWVIHSDGPGRERHTERDLLPML
jgi:hypothetical protein